MIADADVFAGDFVFVVQRGPPHHHAPHIGGAQLGHGGQSPRAANLNHNVLDDRGGLLRRKLVRQGPARGPRHKPQAFLQHHIINFIHHPINIKGQIRPQTLNMGKGIPQTGQIGTKAALRRRHKTLSLQPVHHLVLVGDLGQGGGVIGKKPQRATGRYRRIQLAQGPRRRIARIGKGGPFCRLLLRV